MSVAMLTALSGTTTVARASGSGLTRSSGSVTPLLSCLMRIDLPLGKLCQVCQYKVSMRGGKKTHRQCLHACQAGHPGEGRRAP